MHGRPIAENNKSRIAKIFALGVLMLLLSAASFPIILINAIDSFELREWAPFAYVGFFVLGPLGLFLVIKAAVGGVRNLRNKPPAD